MPETIATIPMELITERAQVLRHQLTVTLGDVGSLYALTIRALEQPVDPSEALEIMAERNRLFDVHVQAKDVMRAIRNFQQGLQRLTGEEPRDAATDQAAHQGQDGPHQAHAAACGPTTAATGQVVMESQA